MQNPLPESLSRRIDASGDCWEWTGYITPYGYGQSPLHSGPRGAHRAIYELLVGPLPPDITLDHLCLNKVCVNPDHLEPVTRAENTRRRVTNNQKIRYRDQHFCPQGHDKRLVGIQDGRGHRRCGICRGYRQ